MPRDALHNQIWETSNNVRGSIEGWDFKQYVLGTLFYRFISEHFARYMQQGNAKITYAEMSDDAISPELKRDIIKVQGLFLYPSQLFDNVVKTAATNENLNTDLANIFTEIENSASGFASEKAVKGLFTDFDTTSSRLGKTDKQRSAHLAAVLNGVAGLKLDNFDDSDIDIFGDAYEFLISNYAANAGKSGGEFFTPQSVSKLVVQLALHGQTSINRIYDPTCGSGSLLLCAKKQFDDHIIEEGFFGQEINHTVYNLARMNMLLHGVNYTKFTIELGNTLSEPRLGNLKPFDAIVANPPFSVKWIGDDNPTLIDDERFAPAGVLAPKSKADFAFVLHALHCLSDKGRAAIVCFPGIFYRGGRERQIRQYLVDGNFVEAVIALAPNLFFSTAIAVTILILSKNKPDNNTLFIDASHLFKKDGKNNVLEEEHIHQIVQAFAGKQSIPRFVQSVSCGTIAANDYNLGVGAYVDTTPIREDIDEEVESFEQCHNGESSSLKVNLPSSLNGTKNDTVIHLVPTTRASLICRINALQVH